MKRCSPLVCVVSLYLVVFLGCADPDAGKIPITTQSEAARQWYRQAVDLENAQDVAGAMHALDEALALDSTFALAYMKKAMLSGDFNARRALLAQAMRHLDHVSEGEQLWIQGRNAFYGSGDAADEYTHFQELVARYPDDEHANYLFGFVNVHHGQNDHATAIAHLNKAIALEPEFSKAYNELAYAYLAQRDFTKARETATRYIALHPDRAEPYDTYAEILMREGDYEASIAAYRRVAEINPAYPWAIMGTAANLNFLDRHREARAHLDQLDAFEELSDYEFRHKWRSRVVSYIDEGQLDSALVVLEAQKNLGLTEATSHEPFFHAYYGFLRRTRLFFERGDAAAGLREYARWKDVVARKSTNETTKNNVARLEDYYQAYALFLRGDLEAASAALEKYRAALGEDNDRSRTLGARILAAQGHTEEALHLMAGTDLENAYQQYQYALLLKANNQVPAAREWLEKIRGANERNDIDLALVRKKANQTYSEIR